jgi:hypothetical protein
LKNAKDIIDGIYDLTDDYNIDTYGKFIAAKAQFKRIVKLAKRICNLFAQRPVINNRRALVS